jgi:hypothetical protein
VIHDESVLYSQLQPEGTVTVMVLGAAEASAAMAMVWLESGVKV